MGEPVLPELPEGIGHVHSNGEFCWDHNPGMQDWPLHLFTAEQMLALRQGAIAYGRMVERADILRRLSQAFPTEG